MTSTTAASKSIGFIGAGAMARAMTKRLHIAPADAAAPFTRFGFCDTFKDQLRFFQKHSATAAEQGTAPQYPKPELLTSSAEELVKNFKTVIISCRALQAEDALTPLQEHVTEEHVFISIMGAVPISKLREWLGPKPIIIRAMPNSPICVGKGATAFGLEQSKVDNEPEEVMDKQRELVKDIFNSCGMCAELKEQLIDPVTGLNGGGPAFTAIFMEALSDGAVKMGVPRELATTLAAHTVRGTGALSKTGDDGEFLHPGLIKEMTCSPGGMSILGIDALEQGNTRSTVMNAVSQASGHAETVRSDL